MPKSFLRLGFDHNRYFVLDEHGQPRHEPDILAWVEWMHAHPDACRVNLTSIMDLDFEIRVSTVFLGLDHGSGRAGDAPVLWETLVFGGRCDKEMDRYTSRDDALDGHDDMVARVRASMN